LYYRFDLSYRDVEELMVERSVTLWHEAVLYRCRKFGRAYANASRRGRPRLDDKWHLDEVFLTIHEERHYLWQAVDQDGQVADHAAIHVGRPRATLPLGAWSRPVTLPLN
jgi:putative transposase